MKATHEKQGARHQPFVQRHPIDDGSFPHLSPCIRFDNSRRRDGYRLQRSHCIIGARQLTVWGRSFRQVNKSSERSIPDLRDNTHYMKLGIIINGALVTYTSREFWVTERSHALKNIHHNVSVLILQSVHPSLVLVKLTDTVSFYYAERRASSTLVC